MAYRIAFVFDDSHRPDTTGVYCRRALSKLAKVKHFGPDELDGIRAEDFDLFLNIDDGLRYRLPTNLRPSIWWAIDTHLDADWYLTKSPDFDYVFTAQRDAAACLGETLGQPVQWLPLACDPEIHRRHDLVTSRDLCFVGHVFDGCRAEMLEYVRRHYPNIHITQRFFDEMARVYSSTRIALNRSIRNDINMRVFETLSCGTFLITNDLAENGQEELFRDGVHLATYVDLDELVDKIDFYLRRESVRSRLAKAGQVATTTQHTYRHRMENILCMAEEMGILSARGAVAGKGTSSYPSIFSGNGPPGLTSIVIPTHNQIKFTKLCLDSVRKYTKSPHELIVIDNGSTDGTVEFLSDQRDVRLMKNDVNLGYPAACNQGIATAAGTQIVLLNNDVVVTREWLEQLLTALYSAPDVAVVGPCSNHVSGAQQVAATYRTLEELPEFASRWAQERQSTYAETDRLVGFCLLFRSAVISEIGVLDERFGVGNFEDDDFCLRIRLAGYRCLIARDTFVHHFGSVTFRDLDANFSDLLNENQQKFHEKWAARGSTHQIAAASAVRPVRLLPDDKHVTIASNVNPEESIHLSLCMIVRDSARTLAVCLESVRPWVDEVIVVDTGSLDETREIARSFGARVFDIDWPNSFAEARNESIRHARGRWVFWMDADDTISPANGKSLRDLLSRDQAPGILGVVMQVHCPSDPANAGESFTVVDHVKVFRNLPELRFEGRVHEQILPAIRRLHGEVAWTSLFVTHSGSDQSIEGRQRKWERDLRLLELELEDHPDHPFALFNLGMTLADMGDHSRAIEALRQSIAVSSPIESHVRKLHALYISSLLATDRFQEARGHCKNARDLFPDDPELLFRQGMLAHHFGDLLEAERAYRMLLEEAPAQRHFSSVDSGIFGFKTRHNLALVYTDMGHHVDAEEQWWQVLDEQPGFLPGWRALGVNLLSQRRFDAAEALAWHLESIEKLPTEAVFLRAQIAASTGEMAKATLLFSQAASDPATDTTPLRALCKHLFEYGRAEEACQALLELVLREPLDASGHHNLGTTYLRLEQFNDAVASFREAIRLRPNFPESHERLQIAEAQLNRVPSTIVEVPSSKEPTVTAESVNECVEAPIAQNECAQFTVTRAPNGGLILKENT